MSLEEGSTHNLIASAVGYPPVATAIGTLLALALPNVVLGVAAAARRHKFERSRVAAFAAGDLLRIVVAFGLGAKSNGCLAGVFFASATAVPAGIVAKINRSVKAV